MKKQKKFANKGKSPSTKPGVLNLIEMQLFRARPKGGVTKQSIVSTLVRRFPDRDPNSVALTVQTQVSGRRIEKRGIEVVAKKSPQGVRYFAKGKPTVKVA